MPLATKRKPPANKSARKKKIVKKSLRLLKPTERKQKSNKIQKFVKKKNFHPGVFASHASKNHWKMYPHLALICHKLYELTFGNTTRLIINMPPRHGKSMLCSQFFPAWYLGLHPDHEILLASYEADFASQWGAKARNILQEYGPSLFNVKVNQESRSSSHWNLSGHPRGGMQTAGAGGPLTGKGANLAIIEDPIKNDEQARSPAQREKLWQWYLSTFMTRLNHGGKVLIVMTRWHRDDLVGRILDDMKTGGEQWDVLSLPAIATETRLKDQTFPRTRGDALCESLMSRAELLTIKQRNEYVFETMYQQNPIAGSSGMLQSQDIPILDSHPRDIVRQVRFWDLAASHDRGDYTVGLLLGETVTGTWAILDIVRGQWEPWDRDQRIKSTAEQDGYDTQIVIEQEGGSGGKAQTQYIARNLSGFQIDFDRPMKDKILRAEPVASQIHAGNIAIVRAPWNRSFFSEIENFPAPANFHDDQVDALSGAFNWIIAHEQPRSAIMDLINDRDFLSESEGSMVGSDEEFDWRDIPDGNA